MGIERGFDARAGKYSLAPGGGPVGGHDCCSWYFVWIGGIILVRLAWSAPAGDGPAGRAAIHGWSFRPQLLCISAPWLIWFIRESPAAGAAFYSISEVSLWDASLNSLPIP